MSDELLQKCLYWCFENIQKRAWDTEKHCDSRMSHVLLHANIGVLLLAGNEESRAEFWDGIADHAKAEIFDTVIPYR